MRKLIAFLFLICIILPVRGGGGPPQYFCLIDLYDQTFNLYYHHVSGERKLLDEKGKVQALQGTTNIAIYDVDKDSVSFLFPSEFKGFVEIFLFESFYDSARHMITYNDWDDDYYYKTQVQNNRNVKPRELAPVLIVETVLPGEENRELWLSHKSGSGLTKVATIEPGDSWHVDSFNGHIRIIRSEDDQIRIESVNYLNL